MSQAPSDYFTVAQQSIAGVKAQNEDCIGILIPDNAAIWMLTGTPVRNGRPIQLYPLLAAIDHPLARDQRSFEEMFCQGHWSERGGQRRWRVDGASRLDELRRLTTPLMLHRRKQRVLGLPPKRRSFIPVTLEHNQSRGFDHRLALVVEDYRHRVQHRR